MTKLRNKNLELPLIQGGMGIGISLGGLAGDVAACGAMGCISTAVTGFSEPDFAKNPQEANLRSLTWEIRRAKAISGGRGLVAINAMVATTQYDEVVPTAIAAGVDAIISGAGLPSALPALAPIVSGGRAAKVIWRLWDRHHGVIPDFVVLEGPMAGGHLGFTPKVLETDPLPRLDALLKEVQDALLPFEQQYGLAIPVFVAGGVYDGEDIAHYTKLGAAGAQIGTRFIATDECDASPIFKEMMVSAKAEDIVLIKSPVGMPSRALNTPLIQGLAQDKCFRPRFCTNCLTPCNPAETHYCISAALIAAARGNVAEGLFFCGSNAHRISEIVPVAQLIDELITDWRLCQ
ncbi:MAG: NAD(P)H-dependent flavin oxidoreductase [Eubacterium aggregans]